MKVNEVNEVNVQFSITLIIEFSLISSDFSDVLCSLVLFLGLVISKSRVYLYFL